MMAIVWWMVGQMLAASREKGRDAMDLATVWLVESSRNDPIRSNYLKKRNQHGDNPHGPMWEKGRDRRFDDWRAESLGWGFTPPVSKREEG